MKTRRILIASAIATVLLAGTACGNDAADDNAGLDTAADTGALDDAVDPVVPVDGATDDARETLALVMAVDMHEVAMAEQAREKGVEGDVLAYADMLHTEHSANLEKDRQVADAAGLSPMETDAVQAMKEKGQAEMERLAEIDGEAYADAYVDAMVMGHTEALAMLDERMGTMDGAVVEDVGMEGMAPGTTSVEGVTVDPAFQQHLMATRDAIANHLEMGKSLQDGDGMDDGADDVGT